MPRSMTVDIDIEVAFPGVSATQGSQLFGTLPKDFYFEEREAQGWGVVIATSRDLPEDVDDAIMTFLQPLERIATQISSARGILRLAVYYDTYTCTLRINCVGLIAEYGLSLEVSAYPTSGDDE